MDTKIKQSKKVESKLPTEILAKNMGSEKKIYSTMFEIFGRVQGKC